jgi:hypothetical protein
MIPRYGQLLERHCDNTLTNCIGNAVQPRSSLMACLRGLPGRPFGSAAMKRPEHLPVFVGPADAIGRRGWMISSFLDAGNLMFGGPSGIHAGRGVTAFMAGTEISNKDPQPITQLICCLGCSFLESFQPIAIRLRTLDRCLRATRSCTRVPKFAYSTCEPTVCGKAIEQ